MIHYAQTIDQELRLRSITKTQQPNKANSFSTINDTKQNGK